MSKDGQPERGQTNAYSSEQGGTNKESADSAPRLSHEQLVKGLKDYIQQEQQKRAAFHAKGLFPPAATIIGEELVRREEHVNKDHRSFYYELNIAWYIVAYDHFEQGSIEKFLAADKMEEFYKHNPDRLLKLSHPMQVRILDVLIEACDIPHKRGRTEFEIPEKFRDISKWQREHPNEPYY